MEERIVEAEKTDTMTMIMKIQNKIEKGDETRVDHVM
jgi:hypothetical protein